MSSISSIKYIMDGFDFSYLISLLMGIIPALICITLHELSHGYVAYRLGDNTAKAAGRLTLNPIKHLDIMGLLMMMVFHVGWAKPVPVNMFNFKNPKRDMAITALAGPVSNILISAAVLFIYGLLFLPLKESPLGFYILQLLQITASLSLGLAVFNFIPIPPLDGSKVLFALLSNDSYYKLMRYERYGMLLMLLLMATGILGRPLSALIDTLYNWLFSAAELGFKLVLNLFYI